MLVRLRGTYQGDGQGDFFTDLSVGNLGSDSQTYRDYDCLLCQQVPADVFGTGALFVDRSPSTDTADRRWWA